MQRVGYFVGECYPDIEIPPVGVDRTVVGLELYGDIGVGGLEVRETRHPNPATDGDTLWVNYSTRRFSSRSMAF